MPHAILIWLKNKQSHALTPAQSRDRAFIDSTLRVFYDQVALRCLVFFMSGQ